MLGMEHLALYLPLPLVLPPIGDWRVMPLKLYRLLGLVLMLLLKLVLIALDLGLCMQKGCLHYSSWAHER